MNKLKALFALALLTCFMLGDPNIVPARQAPPEQPDTTIDAASRKEVVENLLKQLNDSYVFPDTAAKMEQAVRARASKGDYDQVTNVSST